MSDLNEKANQSLDSARILFRQNYYSSTVNRSYYAAFQYILHIVFSKLNKDPKEFYNEVQNSKNGTHTWASKLVSIELYKKDKDDYKWFQRELPAFRQARVIADYYPDVITQVSGNDSISKAEAMFNLLKKHFK